MPVQALQILLGYSRLPDDMKRRMKFYAFFCCFQETVKVKKLLNKHVLYARAQFFMFIKRGKIQQKNQSQNLLFQSKNKYIPIQVKKTKNSFCHSGLS
jgi:hypothetical protein